MVGRLVEHQHIGLGNGQPAEDEPSGFATRQRTQALLAVVAGKEHPRHLPAHEAEALVLTTRPDPCLSRLVGRAELFAVVLGKVPGMGLVPPLDLPGVGGQLAHRDLEQR